MSQYFVEFDVKAKPKHVRLVAMSRPSSVLSGHRNACVHNLKN